MSVRDLYEACLIEANKVLAPALLLSDFVYYINKAILEYFNKKYNLFEVNLLATDDLRVLTRSVLIKNVTKNTSLQYSASWDCPLPDDYVHILNCTCVFARTPKCNEDDWISVPANKLNTNQASLVESNYYLKPSLTRPYYYIINIGKDPTYDENFTANSDRESNVRYGNATKPQMLIKCGNAPLIAVQIDYLVAPRYIDLPEDKLDEYDDTSYILEFPDYVCNEIVKEVMKLILENAKDPRLQTFTPINQSIPAQKTK